MRIVRRVISLFLTRADCVQVLLNLWRLYCALCHRTSLKRKTKLLRYEGISRLFALKTHQLYVFCVDGGSASPFPFLPFLSTAKYCQCSDADLPMWMSHYACSSACKAIPATTFLRFCIVCIYLCCSVQLPVYWNSFETVDSLTFFAILTKIAYSC